MAFVSVAMLRLKIRKIELAASFCEEINFFDLKAGLIPVHAFLYFLFNYTNAWFDRDLLFKCMQGFSTSVCCQAIGKKTRNDCCKRKMKIKRIEPIAVVWLHPKNQLSEFGLLKMAVPFS